MLRGPASSARPGARSSRPGGRMGLRSSHIALTMAPDRSTAFSKGTDIEVVRASLIAQLEAPNGPVASSSGRFMQPAELDNRERASRLGWISTPTAGGAPRSSSALVGGARTSGIKAVAPAGPAVAPSGDDYNPSNGWRYLPHHLDKARLWERIRAEAAADAQAEPALASHLYSTILGQSSLEKCFAFLLANKLGSSGAELGSVQLMSLFMAAYEDDPSIFEAGLCDLLAVKDRDPACEQYTQCMMYFKGYQAVQVQRVSHWLWTKGRKPLALMLQARVSETLHVDIHPGAQLGRGVLMDHATGVVIGETAIVGDNVSMLHHVSLGGSGTGRGIRHPIIGHGVLLGAGACILGPVVVGAGTKIGAGSVVVTDLPSYCVAVGVPARIVRRDTKKEPVQDMDQISEFIWDYVI